MRKPRPCRGFLHLCRAWSVSTRLTACSPAKCPILVVRGIAPAVLVIVVVAHFAKCRSVETLRKSALAFLLSQRSEAFQFWRLQVTWTENCLALSATSVGWSGAPPSEKDAMPTLFASKKLIATLALMAKLTFCGMSSIN
jgi:hypothetical protein